MKCFAEYIEEKIYATPDGGICSIPKGEYCIERHVNVANRKNTIITVAAINQPAMFFILRAVRE